MCASSFPQMNYFIAELYYICGWANKVFLPSHVKSKMETSQFEKCRSRNRHILSSMLHCSPTSAAWKSCFLLPRKNWRWRISACGHHLSLACTQPKVWRVPSYRSDACEIRCRRLPKYFCPPTFFFLNSNKQTCLFKANSRKETAPKYIA